MKNRSSDQLGKISTKLNFSVHFYYTVINNVWKVPIDNNIIEDYHVGTHNIILLINYCSSSVAVVYTTTLYAYATRHCSPIKIGCQLGKISIKLNFGINLYYAVVGSNLNLIRKATAHLQGYPPRVINMKR